MDHGHMDHGGMDHGGMDMDHGQMCNMNMLFTWDTNNLCIVFKSWRVTSTASLLGSLLAVMLLTAGYELVREAARRYESKVSGEIALLPNEDTSNNLWLWSGRNTQTVERRAKIVKAALYGFQVFYSFFIMLLFMTYNGWIMISVGVGAFVGYLAFSNSSATKDAACH